MDAIKGEKNLTGKTIWKEKGRRGKKEENPKSNVKKGKN
jgi:hypothetical protein